MLAAENGHTEVVKLLLLQNNAEIQLEKTDEIGSNLSIRVLKTVNL